MKLAWRLIIYAVMGGIIAFRLAEGPRVHPHSHGSVTHHTRSGRTYTRSPEVRREFMRQNPCPSTGKTFGPCKNFVVDHVNPLACGGPDATSNMAWQDVAAAKLKDSWELNCKGHP